MPHRTSERRRLRAGTGRRGGALGCLLWLVVLGGGGWVAWKLGTPYVQAWRFEDAMKNEAAAAERRSDAEIVANLMDAAGRLEIPLERDAVRVRRGAEEVTIAAEWTQVVQLPRLSRTLHFQREVRALLIDSPP